MSDWIEWNGGEQPVADDVMVEVKFRDGDISLEPRIAASWRWSQGPRNNSDIIAYRVVSHDSELDRSKKALQSIQEQLMRLFAAAEVELEDYGGFEGNTISGYRIRTGAIHKILGIMSGIGYPVSIPVPGRTGLIRGAQEAEDPDLDRLRKELEALKADIETYVRISSEQATENESLRKENAALREALVLTISDLEECADELGAGPLSGLAATIKLARAALQGAKDD